MRSIAGISAALAVLTVAPALPAGAAPVAAPRAEIRQDAKTPGCIVQAALFLPLFLGNVLMFNPTYLSQAAGDYWNGAQGPDAFPGWLNKCGL